MKNKQGFTLIELLLYIATTGIIVTVAAAFSAYMIRLEMKTQAQAEVDEQGAQIVLLLTQKLRNATNITSPTIGMSGSSLTIVVPTGSLSPTITDLSNGTIRIKEGTGAYTPLTNNKITASNLTFTNLSQTGTKGIIRLQFTLTHINPSNLPEYDYSKTFYASAALR